MRYSYVNGRWTRSTLAFECYCQWVQRANYIDRKPRMSAFGPRHYHVWPVFCDAGKTA